MAQVELHPNAALLYRRQVEVLEQLLHEPDIRTLAHEAARALIDTVIVCPGAKTGEVTVEIRGQPGTLLATGHETGVVSGPQTQKTALRMKVRFR